MISGGNCSPHLEKKYCQIVSLLYSVTYCFAIATLWTFAKLEFHILSILAI